MTTGRRARAERGQILVLAAFAFFAVLLVAAALAIDYGNGLLQKRRLQNVADAAALAASVELSRGGDPATAVAVARDIVVENTGGAVTLPYPAAGGLTGENITEGIEVSGGDVRVALVRRNVKTMFVGILGVNTLTVNARARATQNTTGILPITVKRYSGGQTQWQLADPDQPGSPLAVVDYLAREGHGSMSAWPEPPWPGLLSQPASQPASPANPGPVVPLVGAEALPNNGHPDFNYFVAPDVRNLTSAEPEYYNGVTATSSVQDLKKLEANYFLPAYMGYAAAPLPRVGDQLAVMRGVVTQTVVGRMKQYWPPGSQVIAMVYDGTVHSAPDFKLEVAPTGDDAAPYSYKVKLIQMSSPPLVAPEGVRFSVKGGLEDFASWRWNGVDVDPITMPVNGTDLELDLEIIPNEGKTGVRTFTVEAYHAASYTLRTAFAGMVVGSDQHGFYAHASNNSVTFLKMGQDSRDGRFKVDVNGYDYDGPRNVTVGAVEWIPTSAGSTPDPSWGIHLTANPANGVDRYNSKTLVIKVDTDADSPTGEWMLKLRLGDGSTTQDVYVVLRVLTDLTQVSNTTDYVRVLGYAKFQVCWYNGATSPDESNQTPGHDSNTVFGRAISDIVAQPSSLGTATTARLVPWR